MPAAPAAVDDFSSGPRLRQRSRRALIFLVETAELSANVLPSGLNPPKWRLSLHGSSPSNHCLTPQRSTWEGKVETTSVAFTREECAETAAVVELPDRPISPHPNLVTASGLEALTNAVAESRAAYDAAQQIEDAGERRRAVGIASRDMRYFAERLRTAQIVPPADGVPSGRLRKSCDIQAIRRCSQRVIESPRAAPDLACPCQAAARSGCGPDRASLNGGRRGDGGRRPLFMSQLTLSC